MPTKRGFPRQFLISGRHKESTYGVANVANMQMVRASSDPWYVVPELFPDTDMTGGLEEATVNDVLSWDVNAPPLSFIRVKPHTLAAFASYALGVVSTSTVDTSGKKHQITPKAAFELDSFTLEEILIPGSVQTQFPGVMVNSVELSVQRKGWWSMVAECIAAGSFATGSASGSEQAGEPPLKGGDALVWRSTGAYDGTTEQSKSTSDLAATLADISAKIVNMRWKWNNNINGDDLYRLNSGLYRGAAERDRRSQELTMTVELQDASELSALTARTQWSLETETISTVLAGAGSIFQGFNLIFPILEIRTATPGGGVGKLTVDLDFQVMQHATHGSVLLDVYNKVDNYLQ